MVIKRSLSFLYSPLSSLPPSRSRSSIRRRVSPSSPCFFPCTLSAAVLFPNPHLKQKSDPSRDSQTHNGLKPRRTKKTKREARTLDRARFWVMVGQRKGD